MNSMMQMAMAMTMMTTTMAMMTATTMMMAMTTMVDSELGDDLYLGRIPDWASAFVARRNACRASCWAVRRCSREVGRHNNRDVKVLLQGSFGRVGVMNRGSSKKRGAWRLMDH